MAQPKTPNLRRRLEQWLQNPGCTSNTLSALLDVPMLKVARAEDPTVREGGQSPFAIARGVTFERGLLENGATVLVEALEKARVLPPGARVLDFRLLKQGGPMTSFDEAAAQVEAGWGALLARGGQPALLLGPALRLPARFEPLEGLFIPDVVVVRPDGQGGVELVVGEVKAYHDRGGHTDPQKLAKARAQAGLYVCLLRQHLGPRASVAGEGFLVLIRPNSGQPSVRHGEDLRWQARQAAANLERLRELAVSDEVRRTRKGGASRALAVVQEAQVSYREACIGFCDRAPLCHQRACAEGNAAVLGDSVARQLGALKLDRAAQLLAGTPASSEAERDFLRRMEEAKACIRRVS